MLIINAVEKLAKNLMGGGIQRPPPSPLYARGLSMLQFWVDETS